MRLKHIKGAEESIKMSKYYIDNPTSYKGSFKNIFKNDNPIHLEIGMGKGDFIIGMALKYPNINFIGLEKFDSVLVKATKKLENMDIPNLRLIWFDAEGIDNLFDKEIDTLYLNFSDPWPKKRHAKRRLTHESFLKKYDSIFRTNPSKRDESILNMSVNDMKVQGYNIDDINGINLIKPVNNIIMKTDNRKLFEYSIKSFTDYGYKIEDISLDLHSDETDIVETEYEKKFVAKGNVIYKVNVKK